jgi:hypothetical protein
LSSHRRWRAERGLVITTWPVACKGLAPCRYNTLHGEITAGGLPVGHAANSTQQASSVLARLDRGNHDGVINEEGHHRSFAPFGRCIVCSCLANAQQCGASRRLGRGQLLTRVEHHHDRLGTLPPR